jgi:tetratricopeptide (TPR) repeat protein
MLQLQGVAHDLSDDYDKAAKAFESALSTLKEFPAAGHDEQRTKILTSYASALKRHGDPKETLAKYQQAFQLYKRLGQEEWAADVAGRALLTPGARERPESEREEWRNALLAPTSPQIMGPLRSREALIAIAEGRLPDTEKLAEEAQVAMRRPGIRTGRCRRVPG